MPGNYYIYAGELYSKDELYHYGIKGMKWGVRRYQDKNGRLTAKGRERYGTAKAGMSKHAGLHAVHIAKDTPGVDEEYLNIIKLCYDDDTLQEKIEDPNNPGKLISPVDESIRRTRYRQDFIDDPDSVLDKKVGTVNSAAQDRTGLRSNCPKVVGANCLAMMGYDYNAGRAFVGTDTNQAFNYWFDGVKRQQYDNVDEAVTTYLSQAPNGSFGAINLRNKNGSGGHVFTWQKKSNGDFGIYEGQPRGGWKTIRDSAADALDDYISATKQFDRGATVRVYDFTNATPNFEHIAEDSMVRIADNTARGHLYDNLQKRSLD